MDLSKYLARPPVALSRMRHDGQNDPLVHIRLKRPHWRTGRREISFEPLEFLARLVQHIPPLGFKRVAAPAWRQYGAYSAVVRARWRREAGAEDVADREAQPPPPSPGRKQCSSAWAALFSRTWGFDPLECPDYGGRLEIVTAIHDANSLQRITHHYGLDTEVPELKPARAPPWLQGEWEFDVVPPAEFDAVTPPIDDEAYFVDPPGDDGLPVIELTRRCSPKAASAPSTRPLRPPPPRWRCPAIPHRFQVVGRLAGGRRIRKTPENTHRGVTNTSHGDVATPPFGPIRDRLA